MGLLASTCLATAVSAQSLGDVARQEESRRKTILAAGKVYTNENLPIIEPPNSPPPRAAGQSAVAVQPIVDQTTPAPVDDPQDVVSSGDEPVKDEAYWRLRVQTEREAIERAESFAEALQSRINALSTDFVNRDDPAQRNVIAGDRQKALAELDRVNKEIQDRTKAIGDIQQEARRDGVPAGWVR